MVHPDFRAVIPLRPAPIVKHDGTGKHDGARHAAKRFLVKLRPAHPHLPLIGTEDRLRSKAPPIETLPEQGWHSRRGVKDSDHASLFAQVQAAEHAGRVTYDERPARAARLMHRCRFGNDGPRNASRADVRGNVIEYWELGQDTVQPCSGVTDVRVTTRNVDNLMRGGRARWKIEHETFHTLKNQGDNFAHNYGQGEHNLSVVFATIMMLACLVDQTPQLCGAWFQAVWAKRGSKRRRGERMRALFSASALGARRALLEALCDGLKKPTPLFAMDSS
jgi:hypothetical protein